MTVRRLTANRLNAKRSTGPKSQFGKKASSLNALKHGLSLMTSPQSEEVGKLANELLRHADNDLALPYAIEAAQSILDYARVQNAYQMAYTFLEHPIIFDRRPAAAFSLFTEPSDLAPATNSLSQLAKNIDKLSRYERRAFSRRRKAIDALLDIIGGDVSLDV